MNLNKLLGCQSFKVSEVKTDIVVCYELTCLLNVVAENLTERALQKVSRGVIAHNVLAPFFVNRRFYGLADCNSAVLNKAGMNIDIARGVLGGVVNLNLSAAGGDYACIAHLSAALGVERSFVEHENYALALACGFYTLAVLDDCGNLSLALKVGIADKLGLFDIRKVG